MQGQKYFLNFLYQISKVLPNLLSNIPEDLETSFSQCTELVRVGAGTVKALLSVVLSHTLIAAHNHHDRKSGLDHIICVHIGALLHP